jgi:hypothetical protein
VPDWVGGDSHQAGGISGEGLSPAQRAHPGRKFKRMLKEFGRAGLDVRALLDEQLAPA